MRDCEETLGHISSCLDKESERFSSLDSWLQVASDSMNHWKVNQSVDVKTVNALKAEIEELRNLLIQEKASNEEKKKNLEEAEEKFRKLYSDYQMVVKELQNFHEEQKDKDRHNNAYFEVQARGFTEKIDSMTAQLINMEEALTQKEKEVAQMKETVEKCELEKEAVTILKAQVEVYQSDFNAEREARENLAGEKERLAEDLRHLQRRNQQLLDELEAYQQNQYEQMQKHAPPALVASAPIITSGWNTIATPGRAEPQRPTRSSPGRRPSPGPQQQNPLPAAEEDTQPFRTEPEDVYYCPKCSKRFSQFPPLELHVQECLDLLP
ncbi:hypothetical protein B7P43_G08459 [Cryptotermes secundus]|uniref:NF-kappa-B essential modulator NEMO CC2-LZ domain-containing protein n=2 Tax=Cryptotermes secundus TaxID=105785 RepID=A0A2J7PZQ8_9NEOP|nr:hypothetical protein B7P43_G08459 [Cryptotermes secundus]